jgi:hypothetical protein
VHGVNTETHNENSVWRSEKKDVWKETGRTFNYSLPFARTTRWEIPLLGFHLEDYSGNYCQWLSDCIQGASHFMTLETFQDVTLPFWNIKMKRMNSCDLCARWRELTRASSSSSLSLSLSHTSQRAQVLQRALGMCCLRSSCLFSSGPDGWSACYLITARNSGVYSKPWSGVKWKQSGC